MESHLEKTKTAVLEWLEWEAENDRKQDDLLLSVASEDISKPEQPEILSIYRQMAFTGLSWWSGGLEAQPSLLMLELQTCQNAIEDYKKVVVANELAAQQWANKKKDIVN